MTRHYLTTALIMVALTIATALVSHPVKGIYPYPVHRGISTTWFYVGEQASTDNGFIPNLSSAWDDHWERHYGGVDSPQSRAGYLPVGFTPKENPFYVALPYNDFTNSGVHKPALTALIPWADANYRKSTASLCKNRWLKITRGDRTVYAQWEDAGPFGENDAAYVFGSRRPYSTINSHAGLDVSPAVRDYLHMGDLDTTDWQFVDSSAVPPGPWTSVVTTSQVSWN